MNQCPRCSLQLKKIGQTMICDCGWTHSRKEEASQAYVITGMILSFVLAAGALFHFFQWGSNGLKILFADSAGKLEVCRDLKKYDCVESKYQELFNKTGDLKQLEELGELQFKREKFQDSKQTYALYFSKQGQSYKAAYYYAHSLAKTGDLETAIQYFDSILKSNPSVLMVTIMESYLQILVSNNRIDKAKEVLAWVDESSKGAVNTEDQIASWRTKFKI